MFSLEGCDGYILPVSFTLWICFVKQSEHPRVLYVEDKVIFPHLRSIKQLSNSLLDASLYPGDAFTSPFSSEIARTSRRWSSVSSIPYLDRVSTLTSTQIYLVIYLLVADDHVLLQGYRPVPAGVRLVKQLAQGYR